MTDAIRWSHEIRQQQRGQQDQQQISGDAQIQLLVGGLLRKRGCPLGERNARTLSEHDSSGAQMADLAVPHRCSGFSSGFKASLGGWAELTKPQP